MNKIKLLGGPQDGLIMQCPENASDEMPVEILFEKYSGEKKYYGDEKSIYDSIAKEPKACYEYTKQEMGSDTFEIIYVYTFSRYIKILKDK